MEDKMEGAKPASHPNIIIHIYVDFFHGQEGQKNNSDLQDSPVGVKQKNMVVTCNYVARKLGISKCMPVSEALSICPKLIFVQDEEWRDYHQASSNIYSALLTFTNYVEKIGLDENFLDITNLVQEREKNQHCSHEIMGHAIGDISKKCTCGCHDRLIVGSQIALEIRSKLKQNLGYSSSAGVSYNKLLAKIVSSENIPNEQTTLFPNGVSQFLSYLGFIDKIPGIGLKTKKALRSINIETIKDLQDIEFNKLKIVVGEKLAVKLKNLSLGADTTMVKQNMKPLSIGLKNGFCKISVESDVKEKFRLLLLRLMTLVEEDGRIPMVVKVTVRKYDSIKKIGHKETKQSPIPTNLFSNPVRRLSDESTLRLLNIIMGLFHRVVDVAQPFHLTLLGLAFTKFQEKSCNKSIASFLLRKRDLSVQSLTSFVSNEGVELEDLSMPCCSKSESESEAEPSPKKTKLDILIKKRKLSEEEMDLCSPSKLKVADLNLNSDSDLCGECPENIDSNVFQELPQDVKNELINHWKLARTEPKPNSNSKQSLVLKYCIPNK